MNTARATALVLSITADGIAAIIVLDGDGAGAEPIDAISK